MELTDNLNIQQFKPLVTPELIKQQLPETEPAAEIVAYSRRTIQEILTNKDPRRLVFTGPCSLHDREASIAYARKLKVLQDEVSDKLLLIMRAYFEKPRTTLGWKGLLYDPHMDGSDDIEYGIRQSRQILIDISEIGLPAATEFLDPIVPQYLADLISWAAVGARTTESQIHRQMASGLSMPIGFKNSTDGNLTVALDAVKAASSAHSFMGIDRNGKVIIAETKGNKFGHLVMRGGPAGPNYSSEYVAFAKVLLEKARIPNGIIIDCSHANSFKNYRRQREAMVDIAEQLKQGTHIISGVMLESFLEEGSQPADNAPKLRFGQSVTDGCIGWEETEQLIRHFAAAL